MSNKMKKSIKQKNKQNKSRKEMNQPKYGKGKSVAYGMSSSSSHGSQSASSTPKSQFTAIPVVCMHPLPTHLTLTAKPYHIGHTQLKRKRKGANNSNNSNHSSTSNGHSHHNSIPNASRPTFQFRIGMDVGVALGDCFLQLTKLENSMDKLRNVSEDITDVMQCIEQMGGTQSIRKRSLSKDQKHQFDDEDPIEEVHVLNDNLLKWQKDANKRMKNVSVTVTKLQNKLEELDNYHSQAQESAMLTQQSNQSEVSKAMEQIQNLQSEVQKAKMELSEKNVQMKKLKKAQSEPSNEQLVNQKLEDLQNKEKELDHDAEIIAAQSEDLRKESERLLIERDEVRKQKESWQKMINEVKEQKEKLEKRESELQANHKKLLELHETLSEEKKKLHKKAKKIKAREKRLNALRNAQSQYVQQQNQYQNMSSNGSDYAESELTYFSDGDTEIASVNSISDEESDNYHKQQLKAIAHLGVPQNPMF